MKRREFLETGLSAGAGVWLLSSPQVLGQAVRSEAIEVALIGAGMQGRALVHAAAGIPGVRFAAVCDIWDYARRTTQNILKALGHEVREYLDYRQMLAKEKGLRAAIVATPDFVHAEQAIACLKAGLHVYCEKPMAHSLEAARSMVVAARQAGRLLQIGYQRRSNPRYRHVREKLLAEAQLLGRLTHAVGQFCHPVAEDLGWPRKHALPAELLRQYGYADMHEFRNWRAFKKFSLGPVAHFGAHQVDVFNWLLGAVPKSVLAAGGLDYYKTHQGYDNALAALEYQTPEGTVRALCQVLTTTSAGGSGNYEHVMGEEGSIRISENPKWTKIFREPMAPDWDQWVRRNYLTRKEKAPPPPGPAGRIQVQETGVVEAHDLPVVLDQSPYQPHLQNFFEAIGGKAGLACPPEEALRTEVVLWKIVAAIQARKMLGLGPEDFGV